MTFAIRACLASAIVASAFDLGGTAQAQGWFGRSYDDEPPQRVYRERRVYDSEDAQLQRRMRYYSRDAVARRNASRPRRAAPEPEEREGGGFLERLFGGGRQQEERSDWRARADPGTVEVRPQPRKPRRRPPSATEARQTPPPAAAAAGAVVGAAAAPVAGALAPVAGALAAVAPDSDPAAASPPPTAPVAPTTFVAVIGDSVADGLAAGLQEGFADAPELAVKRITKPNSGAVRDDYFDFVKESEKALEAGPVTYAVFNLGVNDRQPFLDMRKEAPLSDEWRKRYSSRLDAMFAPFKLRKIPIYWVGLAASVSRRATADHIAINALARERVEASGGTYVDVWEGFVDEDGLYAESGPLLDGQIGRLRLDDGVHFSKVGARKLAHYVEQEIRKVFQPKTATPEAVVAAPPSDVAPPEAAPGPAAEKPRPVSSPLLVLTAPRRTPGAMLAAAAPAVPARDASAAAARVLVTGEAPAAETGRLDDYRWPGSEPLKSGSPKPDTGAARPAPETGASAEAKSASSPVAPSPEPPAPAPAAPPESLLDPRPTAVQPTR